MVDEEEIHRKCHSSDPKELLEALQQLENEFECLSNKEQAYEDIVRLALGNFEKPLISIDIQYYLDKRFFSPSYFESRYEENSRVKAVKVLGTIFQHIINKTQALNDLHTLTLDEDGYVRGTTAKVLGTIFLDLPDRNKAWKDLHRLTSDEDRYVRYKAVKALRTNFKHTPDKIQAWDDLHILTSDKDEYVREKAAKALRIIFQHVPDKKQACEDLHRLTSDKKCTVRKEAAWAVRTFFLDLPDTKQASEDLHRLTTDKFCEVRREAAEVLGTAFQCIPDKKKAWEDLHRLTSDKDEYVQKNAAEALGTAFQYLPDKDWAWADLHKLTSHEYRGMRCSTIKALGVSFQYLPDKDQAWVDLHRLISDGFISDDIWVLGSGAKTLGIAFQHIPNKNQAWEDLHKLLSNKNEEIRRDASKSLGIAFQYIPDKNEAWANLVKLTSHADGTQIVAADSLGDAFQHVTDKNRAWEDLIELTSHENIIVRFEATKALGNAAFQHLSDRKNAWEDLIKLTSNEDNGVRVRAAKALGTVFQYVPDKKQAWDDLHRLALDESSYVREGTALSIGTAFQYVCDKNQAWENLHRLTLDNDKHVRWGTAQAMETVFQNVPDKEKVWDDLLRLTSDEDKLVRVRANHSLGNICIYKASQYESKEEYIEEYIEELKNSIRFFIKSIEESGFYAPSKFCLPLYLSLFMIIDDGDLQLKDGVEEWLERAKISIGNSKEEELFFKTIESLAHASEKITNLKNVDSEMRENERHSIRKSLEPIEEFMNETEKTAPSATKVMRMGSRILDRKLKEIQEKAKTACRESQGTPTQEIACAVSQKVQKWEIGSQEEMTWYVENLVFILESTIPKTPKNQHVFDRISQIRDERDVIRQYAIVCTIIPLIPLLSMDEKVINMEQGISDLKTGLGEVNENTTLIIKKLDEIQEELKEGFEKLDKLSDEVGGRDGEYVKIFSEKLLEMTKKGDSKAIERFLEELIKDESAFIKEIDSSSAPKNKKEESKRSISKLRSLLEKVKNPTKAFGNDVTKEIVVGYAAKGIIDLVIPMMFLAVFGVPMPSHITEILSIVLKELKE